MKREPFHWLMFVLPLLPLCSDVSAQCAPTVATEKPVAVKVLEIGNVSRRILDRQLQTFWKSYDPTVQLYIINYRTNAQIARREKRVVDSFVFREVDRARITLVRGGPGQGERSVFWKVPPGATNPRP
jgi:hypothetical protein